MTHRNKAILYAAGTALLLLSLAYVGASIMNNWSSVRDTRIESIPWLLTSVALYTLSHVTTGLSWPLAVRQLGANISLREGIRIGLVAQIGKYLPGNIAHYAGRGVLAKQVKISLKISGISTAIELGSALSAVVLVAAIGLAIDPRPIAWIPAIPVFVTSVVICVLAALGGFLTWLFRRGTHPIQLVGPIVCLGGSFGLAGLSIYSLAHALGQTGLTIPIALSAFAIGWGVGFMMPGAPAGIGIREAMFLLLLTPFVGAAGAIAISVIHRLVTAGADTLAAIIGLEWTRQIARREPTATSS